MLIPTEKLPKMFGVQISTGSRDDRAEICLDYERIRISVSVLPRAHFKNSISPEGNTQLTDSPATSVEQRLICLLREASGEDEASSEIALDKVLDVILEPGKAVFAASTSWSTPPNPLDLHTLLYPQTLYFRLQSSAEGEPALVAIRPDESYSGGRMPPADGRPLDIEGEDDLPRFSTKEVHVVDILTRGLGAVCHVLVNGQAEMLCKANQNGLSDGSLRREILSLCGIAKYSAASSICVPRLLGYVENVDDRRIVSFLREWISPGRPLSTIDVPAVSREQQQLWADQIRHTIADLHGIGIVGGDGKPSNIIIDEKDDAWLIDFGGGWTECWVDSQFENTVAGYKQALERIVKWLNSPETEPE